jgi:hypothetical protein
MQEGLSLFKAQVRQVLIDQCVACHGGDEVQSGFDLATRKALLRGGAHGTAVVAGKSGDSNLVRFIRHKEKPFMPDGGDKLPADEIAAIAQWIDLGAPYDKPLVANPRDPDAWTNTPVDAKAREFWSLRPLADPQPPAVKNEAWVRNPIDRFALAKLEEKGLAPSGEADQRVLIRRAHFDLIGLPPSANELDKFLSHSPPPPLSPSSAAREGEGERGGEETYDDLVDSLLASPHYGERWGRHWLDAARFAESHGFEQDYDRPYAYHFRDFVIEALNQDMPYDQFVRWQLAGDELAPENPLALKATGFLGAGVFPTQITANEVERTRYDALDDMAATVGSAMLAFSVGCARCHDHKFDPIPQADYYRLLATFTTTVRSNVDVNLDPGPYKLAKAAFDKEHQPLVEAVRQYEREQLPAKLAAWEGSASADELRRPEWTVLELENAKSYAGATLTKQDDGSLLAGGTNPDQDTFTFSAKTKVQNIRSVRIEALADPSLAKSGPGRAKNGNFALSDFKVRAKPAGAENAVGIKLRSPRGTFEQTKLPLSAAIDENESSAWAVDPQVGQSHAAAFELAEPLANDAGVTLSFQLDFKNNKQHAIGRLRLSVSAEPAAEVVAGSGVPEPVVTALHTAAEKRTAEQSDRLLAWYRHRDGGWQELDAKRAEHAKREPQPKLVKMMVCSEGVTPIRHHTQGADFFTETYFLKRGDTDQKMGVASQGFLQVLMSAPQREKHWQVAPPEGSKLSYRRTALANWITDTQHGAGHLLARVIVNRLWQHHFGRGLVATPNDFGKQGSLPTHPELLDWLAQELIRGGWRLKPLHKLIMTSATYRQGSGFGVQGSGFRSDKNSASRVQGSDGSLLNPEPRTLNPSSVDPENTLLWRQNAQRLEAEAIRDSMLAVSGTLDRTQFGPGTLDEGHTRRSIYFMIKRSKLVPMMQLFDQPEPLVSVGGRPSTTIAPQALAFLNSPHVRTYAHNFAKRLLPSFEKSPEDAVRQGYLAAAGRPPDDQERAVAGAFLQAQEKSYAAESKPDARQLALADFCQVLFGLNEFVYVE